MALKPWRRFTTIALVAVQAFEDAVGVGSFFELRQVEKNLTVQRMWQISFDDQDKGKFYGLFDLRQVEEG